MSEIPSKLQRDAARTIVTQYLRVRPGENAIIESWDHTMPIARAMVDEVRRVGGHVLLVHEDEDAWWRTIDRKQSRLLGKSSAPEWAALKAADVYVNFWGPGDTDRIERLPEKTFEEALAWNWPWYGVARKAGLRGVRMTVGFVTDGRAKKWGRDRAEWEERVLRASLVDPQETARRGARLAKSLSRGKKVRITHANGTDLEVALAGVAPRVSDGRPRPYRTGDPASGMLQQAPGGTLDVALDSKTAEGTFQANRRTNIWWSVHSGGSLEFAGGKLTSYSFEEGEEEFVRQFQTAAAGKDRTSALKLGLNPAVEDVPNLETIEGGSVSLQIGGNRHLLGTNRSNFFTWFSLAGSEIAIDGSPVVRAGQLV
ncbi:MAG: aminopeptidase [Thermoplasmata archaeon]|nr:aminopeptidase [Thermoplasmata archaeon]